MMIAFGAATIGGVLGCLLLLMRKSLVFPVLIVSLLGVLAQMAYMFFLSNVFELQGKASMVMPIMITLTAMGLCWFSRVSTQQRWLV